MLLLIPVGLHFFLKHVLESNRFILTVIFSSKVHDR